MKKFIILGAIIIALAAEADSGDWSRHRSTYDPDPYGLQAEENARRDTQRRNDQWDRQMEMEEQERKEQEEYWEEKNQEQKRYYERESREYDHIQEYHRRR